MPRIVMAIIAVVSLACSSALPVSPSAVGPEVSAPARAIAIGEEVRGTLEGHGATQAFEVTPSAGGILVARLMWDSPANLELWVAGVLLGQSDKQPLVVKLPVRSGQLYRVKVGDAAAWDYDNFFVSFTLTIAIE